MQIINGMKNKERDAHVFGEALGRIKLPNKIYIGKFELHGRKGVKEKIQYNWDEIDMLGNKHEYTFPIIDGDLQVSLQLYENLRNHYRLFCYTKMMKGSQIASSMNFSLNLTTEKESKNIIYLSQKIVFSEQYKGNSSLAQAHRRQKQIVFCDLLRKLGLDVSDNADLILGIFDPKKEEFVNTTVDKFLNDFIVVSILKGHFQGNKGYQLEILPSYNKLDYIYTGNDDEIQSLPAKVIKNKSKRTIPLGFRYKILKRSGFKCEKCGHGVPDGVKLHIDHKVPFSLGGLTELDNLQTLCNECNLSKSNKFIDK